MFFGCGRFDAGQVMWVVQWLREKNGSLKDLIIDAT